MKAAEIMTRVAGLLIDTDNVRWPLADLCDYLNSGVKAIVLAKPSASTSSRILTLIAGTRQTVPQAGDAPTPLMLVDIKRNLLDATPTPRSGGRVVSAVSAELLNADQPNWHDVSKTPPKKEVRHFIYDEDSPLEFYVYPPNNGTGIVEAVISELPAPVAATGAPDDIASYDVEVGLPEPYSEPLRDYMLYLAQAKDGIEGNSGRAFAHYQAFASALNIKIQVEGATSPNRRRAE